MINSKKQLTFFILVLCLSFITACSGPESSDDQDLKQNDSIDNEDDNNDNDDNNDSNYNDKDQDQTKETKEVTVKEQVLLDENDIVISLKSFSNDSIFGPGLKVLIENNSDKAVTVQVRNLSINDVMIEALLSSDVEANKKANDEITFMSSQLKDANISTIQKIEFSFHIFDSENWEDSFESDMILIETESDPEYIQEYDDSGFLAYDENDLKIVMKKVSSEDSFWGADVFVYIENNSDNNITVQARDVSINGFMVEPIFSSDILAGKKVYDTITFMESDLEDNDIETIDEMELSFHIFQAEDLEKSFNTPKISVDFQ